MFVNSPVPLQKGQEESNNSILPLPLHTAQLFLLPMRNMQFKVIKIPALRIFSNIITRVNRVKLILYSQTEM